MAIKYEKIAGNHTFTCDTQDEISEFVKQNDIICDMGGSFVFKNDVSESGQKTTLPNFGIRFWLPKSFKPENIVGFNHLKES